MTLDLSPAEMTPAQRFDELTHLLARGVLRRRQTLTLESETWGESSADRLELSPETVLSVQTG